MKMEMTNEEIRQQVDVMSTCREKGKLGYAIARNSRKMKDAAKEYMDIWNNAFKKYSVRNRNGLLVVPSEKEAEFKEELDGVGDITVEVDVFVVDEDIFQGGDLNSRQMESLLWMIKETKEE